MISIIVRTLLVKLLLLTVLLTYCPFTSRSIIFIDYYPIFILFSHLQPMEGK